MGADKADIQVELDGDILRVTINRERRLNALSLAILGELEATFGKYRSNDGIAAAIVTAQGSRCFAAGGDLHELEAFKDATSAKEMIDTACEALDAIREFPAPVVAALNGDALGGGAELAMACDMRIFASHAKIAYLQGRLNILPSWGGFADLADAVGMSATLALLTSNRLVDAEEAERLGIAQYVAPENKPFKDYLEQCLKPMREKPAHLLRAMKKFKIEKRNLQSINGEGSFHSALREIENTLSTQAWLHDSHWQAADKLMHEMEKKKRPPED